MTKATKAEAQYSPKSNNPKTQCFGCKHFHKPNECDRVEGSVNPAGWCKYWTALKDGLKSLMRGRKRY